MSSAVGAIEDAIDQLLRTRAQCGPALPPQARFLLDLILLDLSRELARLGGGGPR